MGSINVRANALKKKRKKIRYKKKERTVNIHDDRRNQRGRGWKKDESNKRSEGRDRDDRKRQYTVGIRILTFR